MREGDREIRLLVKLSWDGRRYLDMDALTFVRDTPRPPPVMNAAEILNCLEEEPQPSFLRALGVSGINEEIMAPLWDDPDASDTWRLEQSGRWSQE